MASSLPGRRSFFVDSSEPKTGRNGPDTPLPYFPIPHGLDWRTFRAPEPSRELVDWLWALIPPGALVVPIGGKITPGTSECRLDAYDARGLPCLALAADPPLPLHDRRKYHRALRERLPDAYVREPGRQAPRKGIAKWQIEAAFFRDLGGVGPVQLADDLDLRDAYWSEIDSRSARRYVAGGRQQLVKLGAWPWALQPDTNGRLPRGWHRDERFASALAQWHHRWTTAALRDCLRTVERAAGSTERSLTTTVAEAAEAAYRRVYEQRQHCET